MNKISDEDKIMSRIFKKGEKYFYLPYGWVEIEKARPLWIDLTNNTTIVLIEAQALFSTTEYTLNGFSTHKAIEKGTPVLVRDCEYQNWILREYVSFSNGGHVCVDLNGIDYSWKEAKLLTDFL